ncbi:MAG TPA: nucleotidyltransferase family protein [Eubacteriales bacterium]|nr:nucleotidyltransferase family protein [Clostridia bacterium]HRR90416.1 nucleotidyltransferase family protein [Eubacteriales bacterium]HRU85014.1 nucleotidyltransferase family protein [Eubacteriales bacterium]
MKVIILAGGAGTRLKPLTNDKPKPMVNIINKPLLEYSINHLKNQGFTDIALTLGYRAEYIKSYFGDGRDFGVCLTYFIETVPLGTAGGVKAASSFIDGDFLVLSGDAFTDINLEAFSYFHKAKGGLATLALKEVENPEGFGVVRIDRAKKITSFIEKPANSEDKLVNTGMYAFKPEILKFIPGGFYDFGKNLFPRLVGRMFGYPTSNYWNDIGTLSAYYKTNQYVAERPEKFRFLFS